MKNIGFVGGGRVVRIMLKAIQNRDLSIDNIIISDPDSAVLHKLLTDFDLNIQTGSNTKAASQEYVFIAVHPPVFKQVLPEISSAVQTAKAVISLAPVFTVEKIAAMLHGYQNIARMIPNAATFINQGYNPVWYSESIDKENKTALDNLFAVFGEYPLVKEENLEAYAIVTAMGPTYLWPQLDELKNLALSFGMDQEETKAGMKAMLKGTTELLYNSGLDYKDIVDLIPVKPLAENEKEIRNIYKTKLNGLYNKLKGK
jgi:pyrroline-5-carboxylate reductase